MIWWMDN